MKKVLKTILIIFLVIFVLIAGIAIWQWKNIDSIVLGVTEDIENIENKRNEADLKLADNLNDFLDNDLREPTKEEKKQLEEGKITSYELYSSILAEKNNGSVIYNEKEDKFDTIVPENKPAVVEKQSSKDEIINKYVAQLYALETAFEGRSEALISEGRAYFLEKRKTMGGIEARSSTIAAFSSRVRGVQSDCDRKVAQVLENLEKELKDINTDTAVIDTIKSAYSDKKQLKLSYYANKYIK